MSGSGVQQAGGVAVGNSNILQLKIQLKRFKPPIWRRVLVPGNYSFKDLHNIIQKAMPWSNSHMHQFEMTDPVTGVKDRIATKSKPEKSILLNSMFSSSNPTAEYTYDLGDSWDHIVTLEKILPAKAGTKYPVCIAGRRAAPIEHPTEEEHDAIIDGCSVEGYDPAAFDPAAIKFDERDSDNGMDDYLCFDDELDF